MHKLFGYLAAIVMVGIFCGSARADSGNETKAAAQALMQEGVALDKEVAELDNRAPEIALQERNLTLRDISLKKVVIALGVEMTKIGGEVAAAKSKADEFNGYCQGNFEQAEYERRLAKCNADRPGIESELSRVKGKIQAWSEKATAAETEEAAISKETLANFAKKKKLNADRADYEVKRQDWLARTRQLLFPLLEDLKKRTKISVGCANISDPITAQTCLKQVWDGARSKQ